MYSSVAFGGAFKMKSAVMLTWCLWRWNAFGIQPLNGWMLQQRQERRRFHCKGRESEIEWALPWQFIYLFTLIFLTVSLHVTQSQQLPLSLFSLHRMLVCKIYIYTHTHTHILQATIPGTKHNEDLSEHGACLNDWRKHCWDMLQFLFMAPLPTLSQSNDQQLMT